MARITVEDCLDRVPNRFSLVLVTAERAKQLIRGGQSMIDNTDGNKEVVMALREIAAGMIEVDDSGVVGSEAWLPRHRRTKAAESTELPPSDEDDLPPEDEELPPEF